MQELPDNPLDAVGLVITLKPDVDTNTISNFGNGNYLFRLSDISGNISDRIRLFPFNNTNTKPLDNKVHMLANILGYNKLKELFRVVSHG